MSSFRPLLSFKLLLLWLLVSPAQAEVDVLTSIKPLALIAEAVVGEQGRVSHLLPANASPHEYPLKVSDMQRLEQADLVVWVGEELESFLRRPLHNLPEKRRMTLSALATLNWPGESHAGEVHKEEEHGHHEHGHHHHDGRDPHLWLNPENGGAIAVALAERLAERDPSQAEGYRARAQALMAELEALDQRLEALLHPLAERPFAVYHEGYSHFVSHYHLNQVASVTVSPERRPGARHLYELRQQLKGAACLFTEPYYDMSSARSLADELGLRLGEVDLLGADASIQSYPGLLERLGQSVAACLQ